MSTATSAASRRIVRNDSTLRARASVPARVEQLLPVASDALQSTYSVPFPFAEQGSIYAVARIDSNEPPKAQSAGESNLCAPGKVVSASLRS